MGMSHVVCIVRDARIPGLALELSGWFVALFPLK
jgi:hypothetical protein